MSDDDARTRTLYRPFDSDRERDLWNEMTAAARRSEEALERMERVADELRSFYAERRSTNGNG